MCLCVCVNDILFIGLEPDIFYNNLKEICGHRLKGVEVANHHLGGNFGHDKDGNPALES